MTSRARLLRLLSLAVIVLVARASVARAGSEPGEKRVRPLAPTLAALVGDATERSSTFRSILSLLARSDVIVYLQCDPAPQPFVRGYLAFVTATGGERYLLARIRCEGPVVEQIDTVAHELWHASEVAQSPEVTDRRSFERLYDAIGFRSDFALGVRAYDTEEANARGRRVRLEVRGWRGDQARKRFASMP